MTIIADAGPISRPVPHRPRGGVRPGLRALAPSCLAVVLAHLAVLPCSAQSTRDLREENQQLATRVVDLQRELDAARQRIAELERHVLDLQRRLATTSAAPARSPSGQLPGAPEPPLPVSIDESVPLASPRALFNAVVASCEATMRDVPMGRVDKPERANYFRVLDKWAGGARREFHGPIIWHVRVVDPDRDLPAGREVELMAVDPQTSAPLGDTFMVALERAQIERLWRIYDRRAEERQNIGLLELRGQAEAIITINPARELKGTFDTPRLACPFVEYSMRVTSKSLMPAKAAPLVDTPAAAPPLVPPPGEAPPRQPQEK